MPIPLLYATWKVVLHAKKISVSWPIEEICSLRLNAKVQCCLQAYHHREICYGFKARLSTSGVQEKNTLPCFLIPLFFSPIFLNFSSFSSSIWSSRWVAHPWQSHNTVAIHQYVFILYFEKWQSEWLDGYLVPRI